MNVLLNKKCLRHSMNGTQSFQCINIDLATFTEEILNGKFHFLCSEMKLLSI